MVKLKPIGLHWPGVCPQNERESVRTKSMKSFVLAGRTGYHKIHQWEVGGSFTKHTESQLDQHVQNWFICPQCARLKFLCREDFSLWWPLNCQTQETEAVQSWSKMNFKCLWTVTCHVRTSLWLAKGQRTAWISQVQQKISMEKVDLVSHAPPQKVALSRHLFGPLFGSFQPHMCSSVARRKCWHYTFLQTRETSHVNLFCHEKCRI